MIDAKINGHPIRALLACAAEATLLDRNFARTLKLSSGKSVAGSGQAAFDAALIDGRVGADQRTVVARHTNHAYAPMVGSAVSTMPNARPMG
jgi:hypothetical protein